MLRKKEAAEVKAVDDKNMELLLKAENVVSVFPRLTEAPTQAKRLHMLQ